LFSQKKMTSSEEKKKKSSAVLQAEALSNVLLLMKGKKISEETVSAQVTSTLNLLSAQTTTWTSFQTYLSRRESFSSSSSSSESEALCKLVLLLGGQDNPSEMEIMTQKWLFPNPYYHQSPSIPVFYLSIVGEDQRRTQTKAVFYEFFFFESTLVFLATPSFKFDPIVARFHSSIDPLMFATVCKVLAKSASSSHLGRLIQQQLKNSDWERNAIQFALQSELLGPDRKAQSFTCLAEISLDHFPFQIKQTIVLLILGVLRGRKTIIRNVSHHSCTDEKCLNEDENDNCNDKENYDSTRVFDAYSYKKIGQHITFYFDDGVYLFQSPTGGYFAGDCYPYKRIGATLEHFARDSLLPFPFHNTQEEEEEEEEQTEKKEQEEEEEGEESLDFLSAEFTLAFTFLLGLAFCQLVVLLSTRSTKKSAKK
jgi:hypothetical protein